MSEPAKKCVYHDFIAPEGKPEHAICAACGNEPTSKDTAETMTIRYLTAREWVDVVIPLLCVKVG